MITAALGPNSVLQVDIAWVSFVAGSILPLVTGLVTKMDSSSKVKAVVNLVLTVIAGVLAAIIQAKGSITVGQILSAIFITFTGSGASYNHFWKPTGVAQKVQAIAPNTGIGKPIDTTARETPGEHPWPTGASVAQTAGPRITPDDVAAYRAGWNLDQGPSPYAHALEPEDASVDEDPAPPSPSKKAAPQRRSRAR